jgi:ABC-2 type transport system ATP-binding protein
VLDEPMSGMDPLAREVFLEGVLRTVADGQRTVLLSSHSIDDVQRLADTVGILHEGRLLAHASVDTLVTRTKRIRAVLHDGCPPRTEPAGTIWQTVARREWSLTVRDFSDDVVHRLAAENPVATVEVSDLSLEDVFKDYVKGRRRSA